MTDEFPDLLAPPSSINKISFQAPDFHVGEMGCARDGRPNLWHSEVSIKIILRLHLGFEFPVCEPVPLLAWQTMFVKKLFGVVGLAIRSAQPELGVLGPDSVAGWDL